MVEIAAIQQARAAASPRLRAPAAQALGAAPVDDLDAEAAALDAEAADARPHARRRDVT